MIASGFHATYPTHLDSEIDLADSLYIAGMMIWGRWRFPRVMRTDPAAFFARMAYMRRCDFFGEPCAIVQAVPADSHTRATIENILTPSHAAWEEFQERLHAELQCPDFDWTYGAARMIRFDEITTEYWPLCSASIVASMGFAVAESLCLFRCFLGSSDEWIHDHTASLWHKTKPRPGRVPFDASGAA